MTRTPFDRVTAYIKAYQQHYAGQLTVHGLIGDSGAEFLTVADILAVLKLAAPHANTGPHEPGALHRLLLFVQAHESMFGAQHIVAIPDPETHGTTVLRIGDLKALLALAIAASTLDYTTVEDHMYRLGWQRKAD